MCRAQSHDAPRHVYQNYQAQIRLMVKTRFLLGLARKIAEVNGILNFPQVVETLGLLAAQVTMVAGLVQGVGSEFASRHTQHEMFYASASFVTRGHAFRSCDWEAVTGLVDRFLASDDLPQASQVG